MDQAQKETAVSYRVTRADERQTKLIFDYYYKVEKLRNSAIVFVALDEGENIIGYIVLEEKPVPPPVGGADWFIWSIFTLPDLRRRGIASALIGETVESARRAGARQLSGSANATLKACAFWYKHGFCLLRYGRKNDDAEKPEWYGNYSHMIFRRVDDDNAGEQKKRGFRIIRADKARMDTIFDEYILGINEQFYRDKRNEVFGFIAVDEDENEVGFIAGRADERYAPFEGTEWWIPYIFVRPEHRRRGVGAALLRAMENAADEANIPQLLGATETEAESSALFWRANGFSVFYWSRFGGSEQITIGKRTARQHATYTAAYRV
jgi:GNAT superfamily N-acetyltransferase